MEVEGGPSSRLLPVLVGVFCFCCWCPTTVFSGTWQEPDRLVIVGLEVKLPCFPDRVKPTAPLINVHWQKQESLTTVLLWQEGQTPRDGPGFEGRLTLYPRATLSITDLRRTDSGRYECSAWDAHGHPHPNTTLVNLIVSDEIPRFIQEPESAIVVPGKLAELNCVTLPPAKEIRWFHDERQLSHAGSLMGFQVSKGFEQQGMYRCLAVWAGGAVLASSWANITISGLNSFSVREDVELTVTQGGTTVISGMLPSGVPEPVPSVEHNGKLLTQGYGGRYMLLPSGNLYLFNVQQEDAGYYRFSASNPLSGVHVVSTYQVLLKVIGSSEPKSPRLIVAPKESIVVVMGSNVTLECAADGVPTPKLSWTKNNEDLPQGRYSMHHGILVLSRSFPTDAGTYICTADNGNGHPVSAATVLKVIERPRFGSWVSTYEVRSKESVILDCPSASTTTANATWMHQGVEILGQDENLTVTDNRLIIHYAGQHHAGLYQCFLTNSAGTAHATARLRVIPHIPSSSNVTLPTSGWGNWSLTEDEERRERKRLNRKGKRKKLRGDSSHEGILMVPPTRPEVTKLSDHSVMVRWSVPPNNGLAIKFFKVQYKDVARSSSRWMTIDDDIAPHILSYEVSDLRTGHTYRFRISAVYSNNDNKQGPNSAKFALQKATSSGRKILAGPIIIHAEAISPSAINISWHYVDMDSLPIKGFFVHYRATTTAGDFTKVSVNDPFSRDHIISYLLPDTFYEIKMQSFNEAGASTFSNTYKEKTKSSKNTDGSEDGTEAEVEYPTVSDTQTSSQLLYVILGTVFGILVISLVAFVVYCNRKQRRNRREAAAAVDGTTYSEVNSVRYEAGKGTPVIGNGQKHRLANGSTIGMQPMLLLSDFSNGSSDAHRVPVSAEVEETQNENINERELHEETNDTEKLPDIEAEVQKPLLQGQASCQGENEASDTDEDVLASAS